MRKRDRNTMSVKEMTQLQVLRAVGMDLTTMLKVLEMEVVVTRAFHVTCGVYKRRF